jgi:hypothetical protein
MIVPSPHHLGLRGGITALCGWFSWKAPAAAPSAPCGDRAADARSALARTRGDRALLAWRNTPQ